MDVICAQCGEPWDFYGIERGDFESEDIEPFFRGESCPVCRPYPDRRTGRFQEEHFETLLDATDDPDRFLPYLR